MGPWNNNSSGGVGLQDLSQTGIEYGTIDGPNASEAAWVNDFKFSACDVAGSPISLSRVDKRRTRGRITVTQSSVTSTHSMAVMRKKKSPMKRATTSVSLFHPSSVSFQKSVASFHAEASAAAGDVTGMSILHARIAFRGNGTFL
ncbi:hypothetical protein PG989_002529 [Apiospora arundinis]